MRFEPADTCSTFVIETRIDRWLKSFMDADYYLFVESGNDWVRTDTVRKWAADKRVKGIIKQIAFTVQLDQSDKLRLLGNYSVYGPISVSWRVTSPLVAFRNANGLCEAVLAEVGRAAQEALSKMTLEGNAVNNAKAAKAIGDSLSRLFRTNYGVELRVTHCNLTSRLTDIAEEGDYQAAEQVVMLSLDEQQHNHDLRLRLIEEQQRIQLAASKVFALGNAQTMVDRGRWELMQEQINVILGPDADPLLAIAMMMGPDTYRTLLETRVDMQRTGMDYDLRSRELDVLQSAAEAKYRQGKILFGGSPYAPTIEASGGIGLEARLRASLPKLISLTQRASGADVEFILALPDLKIKAVTRDGRITTAKYGTNDPTATWSKQLPPPGSLEESLTQLTRDICRETGRC